VTPEAPSKTSAAAVRSVSAILFNQLPQVVGSVLYVAFVPRILRMEVYGQLAFAFALIAIFQMFGELGYQEIFSRFLPETGRREGEAGVRAMIGGLFRVKAAAGLGLGLLTGLTARLLAGWLTPAQAALIGLAVALRIWTMASFALLLGLGETGKWSVETTWRQIAVTLLTLALVRRPSLTLALIAMVVHEVIFLGLGLWWTRRWIGKWKVESGRWKVEGGRPSRPGGLAARTGWKVFNLQSPISNLLRFGLTFSLANFALVVMFRISLIVVEQLTGSHPEVGFFDLALGGLLLVYTFLGQVAYAFVPILTHLHLDGERAEAEAWLGRFVRYAAIIVGLAVGGMWAIAGPAAPLLFGAGFEPAANTIRAIGIGLLPLPVAWAAVILSAVEKRPAHKVRAALTGLGVFLIGAVILRGYASAGIALAFGLGLIGYAAGFSQGAARAVRAGGAGWGIALGATILFSIFLFVSFSSLLIAFAAWLGIAAVYAILMLGLRVVRPGEIRQMLRVFRR
jgi:O-antigen/teichoic acid export membrane protein